MEALAIAIIIASAFLVYVVWELLKVCKQIDEEIQWQEKTQNTLTMKYVTPLKN